MKDIFFKLLFQYLENLHNLHGDLPFLLERRKIENVEKLIANLHDKTEYIIDIRNLKQAFIVFHQTLFDNSRQNLNIFILLHYLLSSCFQESSCNLYI